MPPSFEEEYGRGFQSGDKGLIKELSEIGARAINYVLIKNLGHQPLLGEHAPITLYQVINGELAYFRDSHGCRFAVNSNDDIFK